MKLDLTEILGHIGMRYPYTMEEPPLVDEDLECAAPVQGQIVFTNTGSVLLIEGSAKTRVIVPCSRCLEYYEEPIALRIDEQFPMETKAAGPRGRQTHIVIEEDESPAAGKLFEGLLFDLTEMLRQGIMLELPTQPLHDPDCKGLCPHCGQNRNEASCSCDTQPVNSALNKLGALLKERTEG